MSIPAGNHTPLKSSEKPLLISLKSIAILFKNISITKRIKQNYLYTVKLFIFIFINLILFSGSLGENFYQTDLWLFCIAFVFNTCLVSELIQNKKALFDVDINVQLRLELFFIISILILINYVTPILGFFNDIMCLISYFVSVRVISLFVHNEIIIEKNLSIKFIKNIFLISSYVLLINIFLSMSSIDYVEINNFEYVFYGLVTYIILKLTLVNNSYLPSGKIKKLYFQKYLSVVIAIGAVRWILWLI